MYHFSHYTVSSRVAQAIIMCKLLYTYLITNTTMIITNAKTIIPAETPP